MDKDKITYIGQKAFIEKDGKVLILRDDNINGIDIPGGKIQEGETDLGESLKREVREETGLEIDIGEPFAVWLFKFRRINPERKTNEVFLVGFRCKYKSGDLRLSNEHSNHAWVDKETYRQYDDGTPHFKALENYFNIKK